MIDNRANGRREFIRTRTPNGANQFVPTLLPLIVLSVACTELPPTKAHAESGKTLAFARDKGNCLACHAIANGEAPGDIGPPLAALQQHFKTKAALREQISDATRFNPDTSMPPFGRNRILTDDEIDRIVDYLWSLP